MLELIPFDETLARVLKHAAARNQECARARVSQNEFDLIDRLRGVERDSDGAEAENGEVGNGPVRPILGNQRHVIAGFDSQIFETQRDTPYALNELLSRDMDPFIFALLADRIGLVVFRERVQSESRQSR